ncbi:glutathione S-transferase family protein [Mixta calida]|uniref:Glutathione S-transferase family protein n=2 Tax=Mixta calida TaxID=665913 RepID=A0ABN5H503_9GAMM|nr:glutathione S-transferase family protein [Mixta calida]AUY23631.1 glutathione S-transferase family protein [Mixta calida]KAF0857880.1 glutathione S-transferase [Mixta calida B021323]MDU3818038.1 glutathione S-transferase family protein [Pantoea sp.]ORM60130.1 glutathione S-transferase [Mixta calida]
MLKVWGRKTSSNVQAVMWCIGELGLPYQRVDIGHKYGGNQSPEFLAMNPNGLVPVLRDGDGPPLFESAAIVRYLASRYGNDTFWPHDPLARATVDVWAEWAKSSVYVGFARPVFWPMIRVAPEKRDTQALAEAMDSLTKLLKIADDRLAQHDYLAGDRLTVADILFGMLLYRYYTLDMARPTLPALENYYQRLTQRPAYQEHVIVPYDELREPA